MELTAAVEGLRALKGRAKWRSLPTRNTCKTVSPKWIVNWKHNGWKTNAKKPVVNQDLWLALDEQNRARDQLAVDQRACLALG